MKKRLYELSVIKTPKLLEVNDVGWSRIAGPEDAASAIRAIIGKGACAEFMVVLHLDSRLKIIGYDRIGGGSIDSVTVSKPVIFRSLLLSGAISFILGHNHPSGEVSPSRADIDITRDVRESSYIMGIDFRDHIIVTDSDYHSIMDSMET